MKLSREFHHNIPEYLPHDKIYLIQVGYKLFRLSGFSLLSDGPSYFTRFFENPENTDSILFIDRNPKVFEHIYNHLQGYTLNIENEYMYIHLWSDSFYFSLTRLQEFLTSECLFANIGGTTFRIPKCIFDYSNIPNYFTLNYDTMLQDKAILEKVKTLRPPPQAPPSVDNRSPRLFGDILELLKGNFGVIKDDEHRALLVRECRYYRFLGLEQRIIKHRIVFNPFTNKQEITIELPDVQAKGLVNKSVPPNDAPLEYLRPLINDQERPLILQINSDEKLLGRATLQLNISLSVITLKLEDKLALKFSQVFKAFVESMHKDRENMSLRIICNLTNTKMVVNGMEMKSSWIKDAFGEDFSRIANLRPNESTLLKHVEELKNSNEPAAKRRKVGSFNGDLVEFKILKSIWRPYVRGNYMLLDAISIEALSDETGYERNKLDFL